MTHLNELYLILNKSLKWNKSHLKCFAWQRHGAGRHIVAISVAAGVGAHQPDRRLPMAQQRQSRCGEVQAIATAATGLACFIFRFLRRPPVGGAFSLKVF